MIWQPVSAGSRCCLPPRVAESKKWVPYFLIRFSVTCCRLGLLPRRRMFRINSGARGNGKLKKSFLSRAKLFTFQRANSLEKKKSQGIKKSSMYVRTRIIKSEVENVLSPLLPRSPPLSTRPSTQRHLVPGRGHGRGRSQAGERPLSADFHHNLLPSGCRTGEQLISSSVWR